MIVEFDGIAAFGGFRDYSDGDLRDYAVFANRHLEVVFSWTNRSARPSGT